MDHFSPLTSSLRAYPRRTEWRCMITGRLSKSNSSP